MIKNATGSTGSAPVVDGTLRGMFAAAITAILTVVANKTGLLTDGDLADLAPAVAFLAPLIWGVFDRFAKPRLPSA